MSKKIITTFVLLFGFFSPVLAHADTCYEVSGAGTAGANGIYELLTPNSFTLSDGSTYGMLNEPAYVLGGNPPADEFALVVTSGASDGSTYNATELVELNISGLYDGEGYYYSINPGTPDDYTSIDTTNAFGSNPVPTITLLDCSEPIPGGGTTTLYYVDSPTDDLFHGYILFLSGFVVIIWLMRGRKTH